MRVYEILPDIEKSIELAERSKAPTISFFVDKISAVVKLFKRYKKALEGLTPGGSEFVDEPERCAQVIKDTRDSQHRVLLNWKKDQNAKKENIRVAAQKVKDYLNSLLVDNEDPGLAAIRKKYHDPLHESLDIILKEVK